MLRFHIPNMTCGGCARSVTKMLLSVDPQARIETDPSTRLARVDSALEHSAFLAALSEAGYPLPRHEAAMGCAAAPPEGGPADTHRSLVPRQRLQNLRALRLCRCFCFRDCRHAIPDKHHRQSPRPLQMRV